MPELPEVQAITEELARHATGRRIESVRILRRRLIEPHAARTFGARLKGARIAQVVRRAKSIRFDLDRGLVLLAHMRMTGHLFPAPPKAPLPLGISAVLELNNGWRLVFEDPRGLGTLRLLPAEQADTQFTSLGVEPLSSGFTAAVLFRLSRARRSPIKLFLMDQRHVAGLGNIYAAEALWHARLDPQMPASDLSQGDCTRLRRAIVRVLKKAVNAARAHYRRPGSIREAEDYQTVVYQREAEECLRCGWPIRRIVQGGRSTFYCPQCQTSAGAQ